MKARERKLKIKQSFLRNMSLETQIFLRLGKRPFPLRMVDMEDDVVAEGLVIFTSVLDELVVSWVVEVGSTVAVGDAFFVAVIEVPVVDVPSLDAVLLTTAFADVVATSTK